MRGARVVWEEVQGGDLESDAPGRVSQLSMRLCDLEALP